MQVKEKQCREKKITVGNNEETSLKIRSAKNERCQLNLTLKKI